MLDSAKPTILIVENNASDREVMVRVFEACDPETKCAAVSTAEEALSFLRTNEDPVLVTLDLGLTGKDGRELVAEIKRDETLCGVPVVVFTGSMRDSDVEWAYQAGVSSFIRKPGAFHEFVRVVRTMSAYWVGSVTVARPLTRGRARVS
jgi:CheY-like chemotaxis protein